jgi:hypothetical protein
MLVEATLDARMKAMSASEVRTLSLTFASDVSNILMSRFVAGAVEAEVVEMSGLGGNVARAAGG